MSRADFDSLAKFIGEHHFKAQEKQVLDVEDLIQWLAENYSHFNATKFALACGLD